MPTETELKLAIDPGAVTATLARLARHPALAAVRKGRWRTARVVSTYLDTPDWQLAAAHLALRVRRDGVRWVQTVKGPPLGDAGGALHARSEYEWPIAGPALDPARLATTPWRALLGRAIAQRALAPRFTTDFERKSLHLAFADGTRAVLCVDVGEIRIAGKRRAADHGPRRLPIAEIEIELETGNAAPLFGFAQALVADLPLQVATANKAARGQALVLGKPDRYGTPVRAGDVRLARDVTTADALQAIALECVHQIAANAQGLLADLDPEWIHQMRIGTRRLRSCLALAARVAPADTLAPLVAETKWLAASLGVARDWDVFATETLPQFATRYAAASTATTDLLRLRARVAARRRIARVVAREAVASRRFQELVLAAGAWCATPNVSPGKGKARTHDDPRALPAREFAHRLLRRRHKQLLARAEESADGTPEARHQLRIAAKKLRYVAEFFSPLAPPKEATPYVKALSALQDVLGQANDAATAQRLIAEVAAADDHAAAAALRGWAAARGAAVLPELGAALDRFAKVRRYWKQG